MAPWLLGKPVQEPERMAAAAAAAEAAEAAGAAEGEPVQWASEGMVAAYWLA